MYSRSGTTTSTKSCSEQIEKLKYEIKTADAIVIGAGAGLLPLPALPIPANALKNFSAISSKSTGFPICIPAASIPLKPWKNTGRTGAVYLYQPLYGCAEAIYNELLRLVDGKDYFVLTTNVDHCFQKAGFDKSRLFYTQGDYGLWQCSKPCHQKTYHNETVVRKMLDKQENRKIPGKLVPYCPVCGAPMAMNLRTDMTFVEDEGWHNAARRYEDFLRRHTGRHILFLELGVGSNTPAIIKYPFWKMTYQNPKTVYACINLGEAVCQMPSQNNLSVSIQTLPV